MATTVSLCIVLVLQVFLVPLLVDSSRQPREASIGTQVKSLLAEEQVLRERLETRVRDLRARASAIKTTIKPCSCPTTPGYTAANQSVAFTSTLHSTITGLTAHKRYAFPTVVTNIGGAYNSTNGSFVAPVSGLYAMSLTIYMAEYRGVGMDLVKEGQFVARVRTGHYSAKKMSMGTNFAVVNITAGERVWVEYSGSHYRYAYVDGEDVTTMTGYLLHQY